MKIVALDTYVTDFDGLPWDGLENLGEFKKYEYSTPKEVIERAGDSEVVFINKVVLDSTALKELPSLKYIGISSTGTNTVDLIQARKKGIAVTNVPGYSTDSVSQFTLAHILHFSSQIHVYDRAVQNGEWNKSRDFCFQKTPLLELKSKVLGIVGLGDIGRKVAGLGEALGMTIMAVGFHGRKYRDKRYSWEQVLAEADFLSLHCPLTSETENLINQESLNKMKASAVLINTARGGLIQEQHLAEALGNGVIAWACLDVLSQEPPSKDNPVLQAAHSTITPHVAWATRESRQRLIKETIANLDAFLRNQKRNRVE